MNNIYLLFEGLHMVLVDVVVSQGVDKVPGLEAGDVRDHVSQERVRRNVERHAQAHVGRALVQLARQLAVGNVELSQAVAWGQRHQGKVLKRGRRTVAT